jgi:hypothetical protein
LKTATAPAPATTPLQMALQASETLWPPLSYTAHCAAVTLHIASACSAKKTSLASTTATPLPPYTSS